MRFRRVEIAIVAGLLALSAVSALAADLRKAQRLLEGQRAEEALPILQQAVRERPNNIKAVFLLGVALHDLWRLDAARRTFERALALDPDFQPAHRRLVRVCARQGDMACTETHVRYLKSIGHVFRPEDAERLRRAGFTGEIPVGPPGAAAVQADVKPRPPPRPEERPAGPGPAPQAKAAPEPAVQPAKVAPEPPVQVAKPAAPAVQAPAQPAQPMQAAVGPAKAQPLATAAGRRVALVIGNGTYPTAPLKNPPNDAADMASALKGLGFEVELLTNAGREAMVRAINAFGSRLDAADVGLFYFAGHGMQIKGNNYLIPVDARPESETDVEFEGVEAGRLLGKMETARSKLNIVILDACRNNPFARSFRSGEQGLARMDAPAGSLIAYATSPGSVAADGAGRNGVYTKNLLINMRLADIPLEEVFKRVRVGVMSETGKKQVPWESSSLTGNFSFCSAR